MNKIKLILACFIGVFVVTILLSKTLPWKISKILSSSMEPTYCVGDYIVIDKTIIPKRKEVVSFYKLVVSEDRKETLQQFVKRVIGVSGDKVSGNGCYLFINDIETEIEVTYTFEKIIPENCYFVVGDNYKNSLDSRHWIEPYVYNYEIIGVAINKF